MELGIFRGVFLCPKDMPPSRVGVRGPWAYPRDMDLDIHQEWGRGERLLPGSL